ncbi:MAG: hypothetical protein PWQ25_1817 [Deferribacteres bacterium]|nr:hypothetical protein [Deferribacteres bacterium]
MKRSLNDVLVFKKKNIKKKYLQDHTIVSIKEKKLLKDFKIEHIEFVSRDICEKNTDYKQIIPYVIVKHLDKIACYQRKGSEKRLHGKYSIGIGGHVELQDYIFEVLEPTIKNAVYRELSEEFLDFDFYKTEISFLGLINEEITDVGLTHLGFVYLLNTTRAFLPGKELEGLEWLDMFEIYKKDLELWSKMALELIH